MVSATIDGITTLFTIGGFSGGYLFKNRLECSMRGSVASSCTWEPYEKFKLQVARRYPAVIPLSDKFPHKICNAGMTGNTFLLSLILKTVFKA